MTMKRRDALKTIGAMAGTAGAAKVLPGCGTDGGSGLPPGIHNIVVVMMENRSYDHVFGARKIMGLGGDGLETTMSNRDLAGVAHNVYPAGYDDVCVPDPGHGWSASRNQFAAGANSGFITEQEARYGAGNIQVMQYQTRDLAPVSWALADGFATCDRYFSSVMGPTWPNRMYWFSGSSNGLMSNDFPTGGWTWPSIHHRLDEAGVEWKYYYFDIPVLALVDTIDPAGRLAYHEDFFRDAMSGNLAPVTYIDPGFSLNDDHPPHHPIYGQQFISAVYNALAAGPLWEHCLLVVTYDEHGGFYDHVAPPTTVDDFASTGFGQMGFRVPTIVAGPYVKQNYVSSVVMDHCSVLRHLQNMFGFADLNQRVTAANDLTDCLDLDALAAGTPRAPITVPAIEIDESSIRQECRNAAKLQHDVLRAADEYPRLFKPWDRRDRLVDSAHVVGDFLESINAGRIVRGK
ncbi:MAG TPA: alkaline phosphatase family protein [Kofleriaceae bacterium]|nr:alkaline phosphatase family protein [Kofleriaceae bacterium]